MTRPREGVTELRPRFCSYYWNAPQTEPDTEVLPGAEGRDWQWDCARVGAHGQREEMYAALAAHGKYQLGELAWTANGTHPVRVAVIDTAAGTWSDPDNNPHGKAVGILIRDTACPDPALCPVRVQNFLGLPLLRDSNAPPGELRIRRDLVRGGAFGAHGDLARAIVEAVDAANPAIPTVINLSVAYDSDELLASGAPNPTDFENSVVLEALQYARCHGALVLAAAGNGRVPAVAGQEPALPARWTELRALNVSTCNARFGIANRVNDGPLLYAVSAVDFGANPLLTTRGGGQSVLAALGFAVVRDDPNGGFTRILSGTSMATATVSAVAAALWSRTPAATSPDRIIRELYDASPQLSATPDFEPYRPAALPMPFTSARRITRCSIAGTTFGVAECTLPDPVSAVPDSVVPELPDDARAGQLLDVPALEPGIYPLDFPWLRPQPEGEPGCTSCSVKLLSNRIDLILRSGFSVRNNLLRLLVKKPSAGIANFTGGGVAEETLTNIADFSTESVPFTVALDDAELGAPIAAELAYQLDVDGVTVDLTESVLLEPEAEPAPEL